MRRGAFLSPCGLYRFTLERNWGDPVGPRVTFVLANPSTADAEVDDPTALRGIAFAKLWGYDGLTFVNVNPFRSTNPKQVKIPPLGVLGVNQACTIAAAKASARVVAAWGNVADRTMAANTERYLRAAGVPLYHLGLTKAGAPKHPLYLRGDTPLVRWE